MAGQQRSILVTGATGNVGRSLVTQLRNSGAAVRAMARTPEAAKLPEGVEVVRGDLTDPASLDACLDGVDSVFLVWPLLTTKAAPAVLAAVERHATRVVYLSSMSVRDDLDQQLDPISAFHADIERQIRQSQLEWTFLRPSGFATNTLIWTAQIRADGVVRWPYGLATRSLIHEHDIAAVAALTLTGDGHAAKTYELTGPEALTQIEQVKAIGEGIGRPLRFEEVPEKAARQRLLTAWGLPSLAARLLPARTTMGQMADSVVEALTTMSRKPEQVTGTVHELTGTPAHSYRQWALDHADDFR